MNWYNLKKNKCPQCNKDFMTGMTIESNMAVTMITHKCGFKISELRYNEIVSGMVENDLDNRLRTGEYE